MDIPTLVQDVYVVITVTGFYHFFIMTKKKYFIYFFFKINYYFFHSFFKINYYFFHSFFKIYFLIADHNWCPEPRAGCLSGNF